MHTQHTHSQTLVVKIESKWRNYKNLNVTFVSLVNAV